MRIAVSRRRPEGWKFGLAAMAVAAAIAVACQVVTGLASGPGLPLEWVSSNLLADSRAEDFPSLMQFQGLLSTINNKLEPIR
ncbi:hypothetical protein B0T16DRAFT_122565 [Cercophora newfieldiana]|uniref:Uncharacterized protein n=1 Tax=Cercophora newfieldiana TaxID=92897 RepID=A0AA39YA64_9PEZI|nr:hypothetical protein B0T16DRAFT_122565 [Cercophora newfieldiana]